MICARVLTAVVVLPALLGPIILGYDALWFALLVAFVGLSVWELTGIVLRIAQRHMQASTIFWRLWLCLSVMALFIALSVLPVSSREGFVVLFALWITAGCFFTRDSVQVRVERWLLSFAASCYGGLPWLYVWKLYELHPGGCYVLLLIAVVMGSDTGGYVGGRYWGRRWWKTAALAPQVSPRKTWEGGLGALVVSGVVSGLYCWISDLVSWQLWLCLSLCGSLASMSGDLLASAIKRYSGVKDSGRILPGHGGFIDRADGFMMAAPVMWWIIRWMGWL